jgi:hypothetical protein
MPPLVHVSRHLQRRLSSGRCVELQETGPSSVRNWDRGSRGRDTLIL